MNPNNEESLEHFTLNCDLEFEKLDKTFIKNTHFFQERFEKLGERCVLTLNPNYSSIEGALNSLCEFDITAKNNQLEYEKICETKNVFSRKVKDTSAIVDSLKDKNQQATKQAQETERKLELLKTQLRSKEQISETNREIVNGDLQKIQEVLGLQIVRTTRGGIILSLTNIEKQNPSRKFSCHLGLSKKKYVAIDSDPKLPQLDKLVDTLNQTNDLSGFVQKIRNVFGHHI